MLHVYFGKRYATAPTFFHHGVIRHKGSVQHFYWAGSLFVRTSNRVARANGRAARNNRKGI